MLFRGKILVPPGCPAVFGEWRDGDITTSHVGICANDVAGGPSGSKPITEIGIDFRRGPHETETFLEIESLCVPTDSETSQHAYDLKDEVFKNQTERLERLRKILQERVANCRGITEGDCWALGSVALQQVLQEIYADTLDK